MSPHSDAYPVDTSESSNAKPDVNTGNALANGVVTGGLLTVICPPAAPVLFPLGFIIGVVTSGGKDTSE